ncbi:MAG: hypothetical protein KKB34_01420 [Bacteroidetes bacterium]|nr:hypothetical protein [Bacteroidota bacterium]
MNIKERALIIFASILLIGVFLFPIWRIDLNAPQYPEGIGLRIWVNKITGANDFDLQNINKLNHYIGMKKIIPEAIPELKIMPFLIGFLILFGLVAAFLKKKSLVMVWISTIVMMMIIGLYDFYIWGYDYGHDLNPEAPIKIPGMVYQPPLIGSKQLLNMNSVSLPDIGAYLIGISLLIAVFVLINRKFIKGK